MIQEVDNSKPLKNGVKGDYHIHTHYSDGVFSPEKIVDLALEAGLEAIALTDHDNVLSYVKSFFHQWRLNPSDRAVVLNYCNAPGASVKKALGEEFSSKKYKSACNRAPPTIE